MKNILQINDSDSSDSYIIVSLKDILDALPTEYENFYWSLFEIEAIGDLGEDRSMPEFEDEVLEQPSGMPFNWQELNELAEKLDDIINIIITGNQEKKLKSYKGEHDLIQSSDILIEFFDSTYWRIYSSDKKVLNEIAKSFSDTKLLKYPEQF